MPQHSIAMAHGSARRVTVAASPLGRLMPRVSACPGGSAGRALALAAALSLLLASACAPAPPAPASAADPDLAPGNGRRIAMSSSASFEPIAVAVPAGTLVTQWNADTIPHTTTDDPTKVAQPDDAALPPGATPWDSGVLAPSADWAMVLDVPGEYVYTCTLHEAQGMVGRITVVAAPQAPQAQTVVRDSGDMPAPH